MTDEKTRDLLLIILMMAVICVCGMIAVMSFDLAKEHNKIFYQEAQLCQQNNAELWNNQNPAQIQCKDYLSNNTFYINRLGNLVSKDVKPIWGEAIK